MIAVGKAKYDPRDEALGLPFKFSYGVDLSLARMIEDEEKRNNAQPKPHVSKTKHRMKIVKQDKYEVGDRVKIIADSTYYGKEARKYLGTIATIKNFGQLEGSYKLQEDVEHYNWYNNEIEGKVF